MPLSNSDTAHLVRDKYQGDGDKVTREDVSRLEAGEPLAYVIGWQPFLGLRIYLDSHPLIPRPETEWWTELLITRLKERFASEPFTLLDLCAGSGAIGLAVLAQLPQATVTFAELVPEHIELIRKNISENNLEASRAQFYESDLFTSIPPQTFDIIATNPPYIPTTRTLDGSVTDFEPATALFAGTEGLDHIKTIAHTAPSYFQTGGELWMEADIENVEKAAATLTTDGANQTDIRKDLYGRPRLVLAFY
jgi:release factor glutamine methyltransferase